MFSVMERMLETMALRYSTRACMSLLVKRAMESWWVSSAILSFFSATFFL